MGEPVRVLIADDSAFVRRAVARMLSGMPEIEVVGNAASGEEAIRLATELHPDVVILDVNMPGMDGIEALRNIMSEAPTGVLMLSTLTRQGAGTTLNALELGAVDFLDKTSAGTVMNLYSLAPLLREKVLAVAGAAVQAPPAAGAGEPAPVRPPPAAADIRMCHYDVVAIGASTGGPRALAEIVSHLPDSFGAGVVVAQHMPAGFTETLADRLDRRSPLEISEGRDGDEVKPGRVLVIPGGKHGKVARERGRLVLRVSDGADLIHRPNINLLFESVAAAVGSRGIGVVLTGMGDDGARGLAELREAGGHTVAESESTAVIFGMPRAAAKSAEEILPLQQIGERLVALCTSYDRPKG